MNKSVKIKAIIASIPFFAVFIIFTLFSIKLFPIIIIGLVPFLLIGIGIIRFNPKAWRAALIPIIALIIGSTFWTFFVIFNYEFFSLTIPIIILVVSIGEIYLLFNIKSSFFQIIEDSNTPEINLENNSEQSFNRKRKVFLLISPLIIFFFNLSDCGWIIFLCDSKI